MTIRHPLLRRLPLALLALLPVAPALFACVPRGISPSQPVGESTPWVETLAECGPDVETWSAEPDCVAEATPFLQQAGSQFADSLMGYAPAAGVAVVSVRFDRSARVYSVCARQTFGSEIRVRLPEAARQLREAGGGPSCLADRRVDLGWQHTNVGYTERSIAYKVCERATNLPKGQILYCYYDRECSKHEIDEMWRNVNGRFAACMLNELPLTIQTASGSEALHFIPRPDRPPERERATAALEQCDGSPDAAAGVQCMEQHGWMPIP